MRTPRKNGSQTLLSPNADVMDHSLDQSTLETIVLLESRLHRLEHLLYGPAAPPSQPPEKSVLRSLADLEHRFTHLVRHCRAYADILKLCTPSLSKDHKDGVLTVTRSRSPLPLPTLFQHPDKRTPYPTLPRRSPADRPLLRNLLSSDRISPDSSQLRRAHP